MQDKLKYEVPTYHNWSQLAQFYHPLQAGSIDGTDTYPHDKAIWRALLAKYKPNKRVQGDPTCTLFASRLNKDTKEATLVKHFSKYGNINKCRLVRDIVTGLSRGYAFIEFENERDAKIAYREMYKSDIDGHEILVDYELERTLKGWTPRRLGGGFGGKKESGQLRFGGRDRPFRRPIPVKAMGQGHKPYGQTHGSEQDRDLDRDRSHPKSFNRDSRDFNRDSRDFRDNRDNTRDYNRFRGVDRSFEREKDSHRDRSNLRQNETEDEKTADEKGRSDKTRDRRGSQNEREKNDKDRHKERRDHSRRDSHRRKDESRKKDREYRRDKSSKS